MYFTDDRRSSSQAAAEVNGKALSEPLLKRFEYTVVARSLVGVRP